MSVPKDNFPTNSTTPHTSKTNQAPDSNLSNQAAPSAPEPKKFTAPTRPQAPRPEAKIHHEKLQVSMQGRDRTASAPMPTSPSSKVQKHVKAINNKSSNAAATIVNHAGFDLGSFSSDSNKKPNLQQKLKLTEIVSSTGITDHQLSSEDIVMTQIQPELNCPTVPGFHNNEPKNRFLITTTLSTNLQELALPSAVRDAANKMGKIDKVVFVAQTGENGDALYPQTALFSQKKLKKMSAHSEMEKDCDVVIVTCNPQLMVKGAKITYLPQAEQEMENGDKKASSEDAKRENDTPFTVKCTRKGATDSIQNETSTATLTGLPKESAELFFMLIKPKKANKSGSLYLQLILPEKEGESLLPHIKSLYKNPTMMEFLNVLEMELLGHVRNKTQSPSYLSVAHDILTTVCKVSRLRYARAVDLIGLNPITLPNDPRTEIHQMKTRSRAHSAAQKARDNNSIAGIRSAFEPAKAAEPLKLEHAIGGSYLIEDSQPETEAAQQNSGSSTLAAANTRSGAQVGVHVNASDKSAQPSSTAQKASAAFTDAKAKFEQQNIMGNPLINKKVKPDTATPAHLSAPVPDESAFNLAAKLASAAADLAKNVTRNVANKADKSDAIGNASDSAAQKPAEFLPLAKVLAARDIRSLSAAGNGSDAPTVSNTKPVLPPKPGNDPKKN